MKHLLLALALFGISVWGLTGVALAAYDPFQDACTDEAAQSEICQVDASNPISGSDGVIAKIIRLLSYVVGAAAVIMIILGGFKYVTANGDANALSSAKNTIIYALIGVIVFVFSQFIVLFVINSV